MGQVSDILSAKGSAVLEIDAEATVFAAVSKMVDGNVGSLLVTQDGRLVGIVTERDYLRRVAIVGRDERTTPVRDIMSAPIVYTTPESSIEECMAVMTERRIRHLPVLTKSRDVAGVVSIGDLVKFQTREQSAQIKFLEEYISANRTTWRATVMKMGGDGRDEWHVSRGRRARGRAARPRDRRVRDHLRRPGAGRGLRAGLRGRVLRDNVRGLGPVRGDVTRLGGRDAHGCHRRRRAAQRPLHPDRPLVAPSLHGPAWRRALRAQLIVDESWAIRHLGAGRYDPARILGAGLVLWAMWVVSTGVGAVAGDLIGDPERLGLDAAFPALFLALLAGQIHDRRGLAAAALGAAIALVFVPFVPVGIPIVAAAAACLIGLRR